MNTTQEKVRKIIEPLKDFLDIEVKNLYAEMLRQTLGLTARNSEFKARQIYRLLASFIANNNISIKLLDVFIKIQLELDDIIHQRANDNYLDHALNFLNGENK